MNKNMAVQFNALIFLLFLINIELLNRSCLIMNVKMICKHPAV